MERIARPLFYSVVALTLLYVTLPTLVVLVTAFNARALLMFPPDGFSTRWFIKAWNYDDFRSGLVNGLVITAWASGIALLVGTMAAFIIERFEFRGKRMLESVL